MQEDANYERSKRLGTLIKSLGLNKKRFAESLGISAQYLSQLLANSRPVSETILFKVAQKYRQVNIEWLMTGSGAVFSFEQKPLFDFEETKSPPLLDDDLVENLAANLRCAADRWSMYDIRLIHLLEPEAHRHTVSRYMAAKSVPPLSALVRFEQVTGIALSILITERITPDHLPDRPFAPGDRLASMHRFLSLAEQQIRTYLGAKDWLSKTRKSAPEN